MTSLNDGVRQRARALEHAHLKTCVFRRHLRKAMLTLTAAWMGGMHVFAASSTRAVHPHSNPDLQVLHLARHATVDDEILRCDEAGQLRRKQIHRQLRDVFRRAHASGRMLRMIATR